METDMVTVFETTTFVPAVAVTGAVGGILPKVFCQPDCPSQDAAATIPTIIQNGNPNWRNTPRQCPRTTSRSVTGVARISSIRPLRRASTKKRHAFEAAHK